MMLFPVPQNLDRIEGHRLRLRLVTRADAAYIYGLRTDPAYNAYLSEVTGTVEDQENWIDRYKTREAEGCEFYYMIERLDGMRCGVVRLYEIGPVSFTWGSWALDHNKPAKAALESAVLLYDIAFKTLNLKKAVFEVLRGNLNTLAYHRRFGATEIGSDHENIYFEYPRSRFLADRAKFQAVIRGQVQ